ncbi:hypothetical protein R7V19_000554 [Acinetobacter baumannii]|nr:hypothetical protein [Acinetobacter baumannii]
MTYTMFWILVISSLASALLAFVITKVWQDNKPTCHHKWEEVKSTDHYMTGFGERSYMHTTLRCRCEKCGTYKVFKLKG